MRTHMAAGKISPKRRTMVTETITCVCLVHCVVVVVGGGRVKCHVEIMI